MHTEFFAKAETSGQIPFYKYLFMADPKRVCHLALMDSVLGKELSIYGASMKLLRLVSKLLPTKLILYVLRLLNRGTSIKKAAGEHRTVTGSAFSERSFSARDQSFNQ